MGLGNLSQEEICLMHGQYLESCNEYLFHLQQLFFGQVEIGHISETKFYLLHIFLLAPTKFFCLMDCQYVSSIPSATVLKLLSQDQFDDLVSNTNPKPSAMFVLDSPFHFHVCASRTRL